MGKGAFAPFPFYTMSKWDFPSKSSGGFNIKRNFDMFCEYCGNTDYKIAELHIFETNFDPQGMPQGHACDVMTRCSQCGARDVFGVAISEDEYNAFPKKWVTSKDDKTVRFLKGYKVYYYKITDIGMIELVPKNERNVLEDYSLVAQGGIRSV